MKFASTVAAIMVLSFGLASCGGEDRGPSSGGGETPTPTPTVSPTPTPSPVSDDGRGTISRFAPFGVTSDTVMGVSGLLKDGGITRWVDETDIPLTWLSGPRTFALSLPVYGSGQIADDPDNEARSATFLVNAGGQAIAETNFYIPGNPLTAQRHVLNGLFGPLGEAAAGPSGAFFYFAKAAVSPPTTGQIKYISGQSLNSPCPAELRIDFLLGRVTGKVCVTWEDDWGPYPAVLYEIEDGRYNRITGQVTASFTIAGTDLPGEVRGQILGSNGQVLAFNVRGAVFDPYNDQIVEAWRFYAFEDENTLPIF